MVLTFIPLPRLRLERQMVGGEACLSAESTSSAAAPDAALRLKEISGGGAAFSFPISFGYAKEIGSLVARERQSNNLNLINLKLKLK